MNAPTGKQVIEHLELLKKEADAKTRRRKDAQRKKWNRREQRESGAILSECLFSLTFISLCSSVPPCQISFFAFLRVSASLRQIFFHRIVTKSLWLNRTCTRFSLARCCGSGDAGRVAPPAPGKGVCGPDCRA